MSTALVHIGLPKTGSTSLQVFLGLNRGVLNARGVIHTEPVMMIRSQIEFAFVAFSEAGLLVPDKLEQAHRNLVTVEDQHQATKEFEAQFDAALQENSNAQFVISCEQLGAWCRTPELRLALDRWLANRFSSVVYLMFVRPMEDFLVSIYSEAVKRGLDVPLDEFIHHEDELRMANEATQWSHQFPGRVQVRLLPENPDDIYQVFCDAIKVSSDGLTAPRKYNTSLSTWEVKATLLVNRLFGPPAKRSFARRWGVRQIRKMIRLLLGWGPRLSLSEQQKAVIRKKHPESLPQVVEQLNLKEATAFAAHTYSQQSNGKS